MVVVTEQPMAEVLRNKPVDGQSCIQLEIVAESSSQTAARAEAGELGEQLWIPDSTARLSESSIGSEVLIHTPSPASSPAVVAGRDQVEVPETWSEVLADESLLMSDPAVDAGAFAALQGVAHDVDTGAVSEESAVRALTPRATTQGVDSPFLLAPELLADVRDNGTRAVVSERAFLTGRAKAGGDQLTAVTPASATAFLDFPLVIPWESGDSTALLPDAADEIQGWLRSDDGQRVLAAAHYRTPQGETPDPDAVPVPARFQKPATEVWETVDGNTQRATLRHNLSTRSPRSGGHTELHQSTLAAFRYQQENFKTGQLNAVVLISDGERGSSPNAAGPREDDVDESVPLYRLLKHLGSEQDPARPVVIITVETSGETGAGPGDDSLSRISEATGGSHLTDSSPADLRAALRDAVVAEADVG